MISALVLTLNEEANLARCLDSLSWCEDIVVLDSFSTDNTVRIAEERGCRVFKRTFDSFAEQRNYALSTVTFKNNWILHMDADEVLTQELIEEIKNTVADTRFDAFRIPSRTIFHGRWLKHSGLYPSYQVRLTRLGAFRFRQVGHGQKEDIESSRIGTLNSPYDHYSFSKGLEEWFAKHNRYSTSEALAAREWPGASPLAVLSLDPYRRRAGLKSLSRKLPARPLLRFLYMYALRLGFLDGRPGFQYCRLLAIYEAMITAKIADARISPHRP